MNKKNLKEALAAGDKFAEKKDWDNALEAYEKALEADPFDKVIHERIIKCYIGKHDRHGYLEAVNRWKQLKESPHPKKGGRVEKLKPEQTPIFNTIDIEEEEKPPTKPPAKPFVALEPPRAMEPPKPPPIVEQAEKVSSAERSGAGQPPPREPARSQPPAEFLRKEPSKPPASPLREIPFPLKPEPKPVKSEPAKSQPEPDAKPAQKPAQKPAEEFASGEPSREKAPPEGPKTPVTEADLAEADARQLERQGKKDAASKSYVQAAKLWEDKGDKDKAGIAYEKAYEAAPSMEILTRLNELYGQGVKLKQSTVMEIYRRIYHMKV